jgi:type I restriction enzyme M protein
LEAAVNIPVSEKFARLVDLAEITANDYNLNISRYIDTSEREAEIHLHHVKAELEKLAEREREIDEKLAGFLNELGI